MTLKFSEKAHRYQMSETPDSTKLLPVQGVTTILGAGIPKPALPRWAAKSVAEWVADNEAGMENLRNMGRAPMVEALKNVPWQVRDEAAVRGTEVHALAEKLIHGEGVQVPEHLAAHVKGYADLLDDFGITPILTEVSVGNRALWYAGRLDAIVRIKGEVFLLDWKTSKGVYGETGLQTAAYARAEFFVEDNEWETELELPHIDRIGVVHITAEGSTLHSLGDINSAFKVFQHVHYLASKVDWIKELVSEPLVAGDAA